MATWYYTTDGTNQVGPLDDGGIKAVLAKGELQPQHLVFKIGDSEWRQAKDFPELLPPIPPVTPPPVPVSPAQDQLSISGTDDSYAAGVSFASSDASDALLSEPSASEIVMSDLAVADAPLSESTAGQADFSGLGIAGNSGSGDPASAAPKAEAAPSQPDFAGLGIAGETENEPSSAASAAEAAPVVKTATQSGSFDAMATDIPSFTESSGAGDYGSDGASHFDALPWTVKLVQAENGNWGAEVQFTDATQQELKAVRALVKQYASIAFGGLPRVFAGDQPNKIVFNLSTGANKPLPWKEEERLPESDLPALRDTLFHTVKVLHANDLAYWVFDERLAWRLPEGFKLAPAFWLPVFTERKGNFASAAPEWRDGPNVQPFADTYTIACACFYAATGSHFDPELSMLPGDVYPPAEILDAVLAPALQQRPSRRPEDMSVWRQLWVEKTGGDEPGKDQVQGESEETVEIPTHSSVTASRVGGTRSGGTKIAKRGSTVVTASGRSVTKVKTKQRHKSRRSGGGGPKPEYGKDVIPVDRESLGALRYHPLFWVTLLLGVLPLLVHVFGDASIRNGTVYLFLALLWGGFFRAFIMDKAGRHELKPAVGAFVFTGVIGVFCLFAVYSFLPPFLVNLSVGRNIMQLPGLILIPGITEEACKLVPIILYFALRKDNANVRTAVVMGVASGLGLTALKEPVVSSLVAPVFGDVLRNGQNAVSGIAEGFVPSGPMDSGALLLLIALLFGQALWGGIGGYFLAAGSFAKNKRLVLGVFAIVVPAALHGAYLWLCRDLQYPAAAAVLAVSLLMFYGYLSKLTRGAESSSDPSGAEPMEDANTDDAADDEDAPNDEEEDGDDEE